MGLSLSAQRILNAAHSDLQPKLANAVATAANALAGAAPAASGGISRFLLPVAAAGGGAYLGHQRGRETGYEEGEVAGGKRRNMAFGAGLATGAMAPQMVNQAGSIFKTLIDPASTGYGAPASYPHYG